MYVKSYEYLVPTEHKGDHIEIDGISRDAYATDQFISKMKQIVTDKKTAVLFSAGVSIHQSESRSFTNIKERYVGSVDYYKSTRLIKELSVYSMHRWIGSMSNPDNVVYATINSNSCASSMHSVYEAEMLLVRGECEEVVIITEERTSFNTIRIFKEHNIPLVVSDGIAIMVLSLEPSDIEITDTKWGFEYSRNPFGTTQNGYSGVSSVADNIKPHGTGTDNNDTAELTEVEYKNRVLYKKKFGHMQGASTLVEMCLLIDDSSISGSTLCLAAGLGGFYGGCVLHKKEGSIPSN